MKKSLLYSLPVLVGGALLLHHINSSVIQPQSYKCAWTPGDYTNFVVLTSLSIPGMWSTYLEMQDTNFIFIPDVPQRFFAIYGTNLITGESAWAGQQ